MNSAFRILPILSCGCLSLHAGWLERKAEGWAWYEDPKLPLDNTEKKVIEKTLSAAERVAETKKQLEEMLALAILEPNEDNVQRYMEEQHKWLEQSGQFSNIWAKVILRNPQLDPTATYYPVSQYGVQVQKMINREKKQTLITTLSKTHGLFFFYEGRSRLSQAQAQIVQLFAKQYAWEVIAITQDGVLIEGFANNKQDNGIAETMHVATFPALFVIEPLAQKAIPLGYGLATIDQIEQNLWLQFHEASLKEANS